MSLQFLSLFRSRLVDNVAVDIIYTVPALSILRNGKVRFSNVTATAATIKMWAVPISATANNNFVALPTVSIPANSYLDIDLPVIDAGGMIQAQAGTASSISILNLDGLLKT